MFESLNVEERAERCFLENPVDGMYLQDNDGNYAYVDVLSMESETGRKLNHRMQNEMLKQQQRGKKKGPQLTAEQLESNTAETLAELTQGWYLVHPTSGEPIEDACTKSNAYELYQTVPWIRQQVEDFANDVANFFRDGQS